MDKARELLERLIACAELNQDNLEEETCALLDEIDDFLYPRIFPVPPNAN